jgi:hypothetical protein
MKDLKKWFEDQNIEPVQDRNDGMDYHKNYELFTYNDLMECMEALLILHGVSQQRELLCEYTRYLKKQGTLTKEQSKIKLVDKFILHNCG